MMVVRFQQLAERLIQLSRFIRIMIVVFFALMMTLAVSPMIDHIYIRFFFSAETVILPSLVTVAIGSIFYIWGWKVYVGTVGEDLPAENRILWYFGVGILATIIVVGLFVQGVALLNLPIESA